MTFNFTEKVMCINGSDVPSPLQFYKRGFNLGGSSGGDWQDIILSGNTALTLVNAKADGINYLKLFGGTGTFTAGADVTTPSPNYPIDIVSNNGVVKVSKNLFNYVNFYANYVTIAGSSVGRLAIQLKPNTQYILSTNTQISPNSAQVWVVSGNDTNFTPNTSTNGVLIDTPRTVTSDSNGYICLGIRTAASGSITPLTEQDFINGTVWLQIEEGAIATTYRPYGQIYTDGTVETVEVIGKNLFDKNAITEGYIYNAQLEYVTSDIGSLSDYIPVVAGQPYTFTGYKEMLGNFNIRINYFDINKEIQSQDVQPVGQGNYNFTITMPSGIKYLRYSFRTEMADSQQLEQGSTATTYEPYYYGGQATAEMLLKVGSYKDEQEVLAGSVSRSVGIKVLDGTEDWIKSTVSGVGSLFYCTQTNMNYEATSPALCTHYIGVLPNVGGSEQDDKTIKAGYNGSSTTYIRMYLKDSSFSTTTDLTTFLASQYNAGTPVIVVYPLAEPTTETVTGQPLSIQTGTNIVEITQASIDNLGLKVSYKATI